jgi:hypothetical protein
MSMISEFAKVPDVIWSGVIASVLTLSGVLLSNWITLRAQRLRLRHEASESALQRKASLRRDVYLAAVDEFVRASAYLASVTNRSISDEKTDEGLVNLFIAVSRLQLVAGEKTSVMVNELAAHYSRIQLAILPKLSPLKVLKADIEFHDTLYDRTQVEIKRVLALMTQFVESGATDTAQYSRLAVSAENSQREAERIDSARQDKWKKYLPGQQSLLNEILIDLQAIQVPTLKVLGALRDELEIGGSMDEFIKLVAKGDANVIANVDAALREAQQAPT